MRGEVFFAVALCTSGASFVGFFSVVVVKKV